MSIHRSMRLALAAAVVVLVPAQSALAHGGDRDPGPPRLVGRAVVPVETYTPGPPSGASQAPVVNGINFPTPSQPFEGISSLIDGRRSGEYLAMPDNGYGGKATSTDFLIRAYYVKPDFKTKRGGSGAVAVGTRDFIQFSDPWRRFPYPLVRSDRLLTGGDIDPESLQRDHRGDLWVGDEFGPWLLHFDPKGRLLEAPISLPDGLISPNNPALPSTVTPNVLGSRGIEAMAITPNGKSLIIVMEGAIVGDADLSRRVYRYDIRKERFTRLADYVVDSTSARFVSDAQALSDDRLVLIERDGGRGATAVARPVYAVDLAPMGATTTKSLVVELAAIPDPDLVSLPAIHEGDIGLGNPFQVTCESIESVHVLGRHRLMFTCDNNFPNTGRNPVLADDTEMIVVETPAL